MQNIVVLDKFNKPAPSFYFIAILLCTEESDENFCARNFTKIKRIVTTLVSARQQKLASPIAVVFPGP